MKGFKIVEILRVKLDEMLLELHFNAIKNNKKLSISLRISDDAETVLVSKNSGWVALEDIQYEAFVSENIEYKNSEIGRLIENEIKDITFGIGKTIDTLNDVVYYVKVITNQNEFLFFNNGDEGAYSFDRIDEILANDLYGYQWNSQLPSDT